MNNIKSTILAVAISAVMVLPVMATSYTQSSGTGWSQSSSATQTHNTTALYSKEVTYAKDTGVGGLGVKNVCGGTPCSAADNVVDSNEKTVKITNLNIDTIGSSLSTEAGTSCFSGVSINGLSAVESRSTSNFGTAGSSVTKVTGNVITNVETSSHSTSNGAESGSSSLVSERLTKVSEVTNKTYSSGGETITFTSSIGK